jgi:hypothetical protein
MSKTDSALKNENVVWVPDMNREKLGWKWCVWDYSRVQNKYEKWCKKAQQGLSMITYGEKF